MGYRPAADFISRHALASGSGREILIHHTPQEDAAQAAAVS